ncbi:MAG: aldehyde dehydrogenase [Bradyrhizobium sp.]|uniref:aldehyde dehydrogenase n=1 Tax=Bradyrhizobium sp. TaxID=376 RepID=UPI0029B58047|nr:aldehyde dehydrogenase [Bradyrhizobium sp.]MDX3969237.1 aldehyde dehydrogenase [Bradyrhizobium sp.]
MTVGLAGLRSEREFERRDPVTGKVASTAPAMSVDQARAAADYAHKAFPAWARTGLTERRRILLKAADLLEAATERLANLMSAETGAALPWIAFNARLSASLVREAASLTSQIAGQVLPSDHVDNLVMVVRNPAGVVLSISPWNAPVILAVRAIATPLACGDTVVFKASELCPGTHRIIVDLFHEAGVPEGALQYVSHNASDAAEIVEALIAHPAVKRVNFTGSTRVGRIIGASAGRHLKPALLELGGKAPLLVLDDAALDEAVAASAFGAFMHQGQICMSTERIVVDEKVADPFVEKLAAKADTLVAGNPKSGNAPLGSVVDQSAVERVRALIDDALAKGADLRAGGQINGTLINATVLDRVTPAMRIYQEESFGPIVSVVRSSGIEESIRIANDTEYGLAAAVFGRDVERALAVARRIEAGLVHINGPTVQDEAHVPFGGVKASGYGRFNGQPAIDFFTELKTMTVQYGPRHYPI